MSEKKNNEGHESEFSTPKTTKLAKKSDFGFLIILFGGQIHDNTHSLVWLCVG